MMRGSSYSTPTPERKKRAASRPCAGKKSRCSPLRPPIPSLRPRQSPPRPAPRRSPSSCSATAAPRRCLRSSPSCCFAAVSPIPPAPTPSMATAGQPGAEPSLALHLPVADQHRPLALTDLCRLPSYPVQPVVPGSTTRSRRPAPRQSIPTSICPDPRRKGLARIRRPSFFLPVLPYTDRTSKSDTPYHVFVARYMDRR